MLWLQGPPWLLMVEFNPSEVNEEVTLPEECIQELKKGNLTTLLTTVESITVVDCSMYSTLGKLTRITTYVPLTYSDLQHRNDS